MLEQQPLRVFLSYASKDRLTIRHLYNQLSQAEGIQPWFDETILMPGEEWEQEIATAVQSADVVAVCLSNNAVTKTGDLNSDIVYALQEVGKREDTQPHVLLVILETCDIPESLQRFQAVNWVADEDYAKVVALLQTFCKTALPSSDGQAMGTDAASYDAATQQTDGMQQATDSIPMQAPPTKQDISEQVAASTSTPSPRARQKPSGKDDEQWIQEIRRRTQDPKNKPTKAQPAAVVAAPTEKRKRMPIIAIVVALVAIIAVVGIWMGLAGSSAPAAETDEQEVMRTLSPTTSADSIASPASTSERFAPHRILDPSGSMTPTLEPPARDESTESREPTRTTTPLSSDVLTPTDDMRTPTEPSMSATEGAPTDTPMPTSTLMPTEQPAADEPNEPQVYVIQPSDTILAIAEQYDVTVLELMELNDMSAEDADNIMPDQEILIPAPSE